MEIHWPIVLELVKVVVAAGVGAAIKDAFERRPRLVTYYGHASGIPLQPNPAHPNAPQTTVHTHSVVVRNAGRLTANNVRLSHAVLPRDFAVQPPIPYSIQPLAGGSAEIVLPKLVPGEQITVTYIYFPPLLWNQINTSVRSDEGMAKFQYVLPTPQPPKWVQRIVGFLLLVGLVTFIYLIIEIAEWVGTKV